MVKKEIIDRIEKIKNGIGNIGSKIRRGKFSNRGSKRERSSCPVCGSISIKKRTKFKGGYVCSVCGWEGKSVIKTEWPP